MEFNRGMFAIKLYELNQQYNQLQSRILLCQNGDHGKILQEIKRIVDECMENDLLLQSRIESSRSPAVSRLAAVQMDYRRKTEEILRNTTLGFQDGMIVEPEELESVALYAEYAIDFATQAMRHALQASLCAIDLQLTEEEIKKNRRY